MRTSVPRFSDPKSITGIAVILGMFVMVFALKLHTARVQTEITALRSEMSPFISSATDNATDLPALRSERYAMETRFDPLFALAGSDTDGMRKALIPLQGEASEILGSYSPEERAQIEPVLYPHTFLSSLPDLEDMRRAVIASPSTDAVRRYNEQLRKTIVAYRNDIALYRETLANLQESDKSTTIHYLAGSTTVSAIISKLDTLDRRALALETKREQRYRCFTGEYTACTPLASSFATMTAASLPITPSVPPTTLSKSLVYRDIVRKAFSEMLGTQETYETVVKISRSECISGTPAAYYYFFQSREEEGVLSSTATPLNDLYFYDLTDAVNSQKNPPAYLQKLYTSGLRYNFQNIGNLYFCPNSGNVLAQAATLVSLHEKIKKSPLFTDQFDAFPDLARLEKRFTTATIASDEDMDWYFSAVKETLRNDGEHVLSEKIGSAKLFELEELLTEWTNRSSHFEQSLTAAHHINRLSKGIIFQSKAPVYALLTSRVYTSIFLMTFNASVAGEQFLFLDSINTQPALQNFHLIPYSKGLRGSHDTARVFEELHHEQAIIDAVLRVER